MKVVRKARAEDLGRIAEIEVFNYRLNFYPIFRDDAFYFDEFQVTRRMEFHKANLNNLWVYDDGVVKGFLHAENGEIKKLFVEPVLQGQSIGAALLEHVVAETDARFLWALEKNVRAIAFYEKHGFHPTDDKQFEEDTTEYLVRLER